MQLPLTLHWRSTLESGADVITAQSGALDLNVDAGAGADSITVTGSTFAAADTVAGGDGTDTVTLSGAATLTDGAFANKTTVEALTAANATNSLTLGNESIRLQVSPLLLVAPVLTRSMQLPLTLHWRSTLEVVLM